MTREALRNVSDADLAAELRRRCDDDPLLQGGLGREVLSLCDREAIWSELIARNRDVVLVMVPNGSEDAEILHTAAYAAIGLVQAAQRHLNNKFCGLPLPRNSSGESE